MTDCAWLIAPTEHDLSSMLDGITDSLPEQYGADLLRIHNGRILGIQRKKCPEDLLASLSDGRLARELPLLAQLDYPILLVEEWPEWSHDGHMLNPFATRWTIGGLRNLLRSVWWQFGVAVEYSKDLADTVIVVEELAGYFEKETHRSLLTRPKTVASSSWGKQTPKDWGVFFLQGLPGVGSVLAEQIYDYFGRVPMKWDIKEEALGDIAGIGKKRMEQLFRVFGAVRGG